MDALSFVLGVSSTHLRSGNLNELIYRNDVLNTESVSTEISMETPKKQRKTRKSVSRAESDDQTLPEYTGKTSVSAFYQRNENTEEIKLSRRYIHYFN